MSDPLPRIPGVHVDGLIGLGGVSSVYRGREVAFNRSVAVKLLGAVTDDAERLEAFRRECALIGMLSPHPNVVTVYSQGVGEDGRPYLVMELCPNGSLETALRSGRRFELDEVLRIGVGLAGALETAHLQAMLHRDVKPDNVLLASDGTAKVTDFGIATLLAGDSGVGEGGGMTPVHASPEQVEGRPVGIRSDVYSFGSTLFALLEGHAPIDAEHRERRPLVREVPDELRDLIERMLAQSPATRPGSMAEVGAALQDIERSLAMPVTPLTVIEADAESFDLAEDADPEVVTQEPSQPIVVGSPDGARSAKGSRRSTVLAATGAIAVAAMVVGAWAIGRGGSTGSDNAGNSTAGSSSTTAAPPVGVADPGTVDWASARPLGRLIGPLLFRADPALAPKGAEAESSALRAAKEARVALIETLAPGAGDSFLPIGQWPALVPYNFPAWMATNYFNADVGSANDCTGFKSSVLPVVDGRTMLVGTTEITVFEFGSEAGAEEAFVGQGLVLGIEPDRCRGFGANGYPARRSDMSVARNDFGLEGPADVDGLLSGAGVGRDESIAGVVVRRGRLVAWAFSKSPDGSAIDPADTVVRARFAAIVSALGTALADG